MKRILAHLLFFRVAVPSDVAQKETLTVDDYESPPFVVYNQDAPWTASVFGFGKRWSRIWNSLSRSSATPEEHSLRRKAPGEPGLGSAITGVSNGIALIQWCFTLYKRLVSSSVYRQPPESFL